MHDQFGTRQQAVQTRLQQVGADALILFPSRNLQYLTGFYETPSERHFLYILPAVGESHAVVPALAVEQFTTTVANIEIDIHSWDDATGPDAALSQAVTALSLADGHLLVDDSLWARFTHHLREIAHEATFGLASEVLSDIRMRKDAAERDALRRAGAAADQALETIRSLGSDAIGLTETELAHTIETELTAAGGSGVSFETIVGSGPNGAMPHRSHSDRVIQPGDPVVLDFGTRVDGYPSDQTRTVVFAGEPTAEFKTVHKLVKQAQQAAVAAVSPGMTAGEVDAAARDRIEAGGYGEQFIHRTGHGVGLEVHEAPDIVSGSDTVLEPGMVFSIEPGVYLKGQFGVRIEDLVVVTEDGCERLNTTDRGWDC
ncbi:M24 family metallopeptidase [Natronocalculus amylovorans]|uniref:Xaa-Pro peptidase family protein n=1 Tax=Natronocalculus amylovorans TaxID=2917812 RepID=A0AAE3FYE5_9EURY|nr:Xaa-Pro peptidase family protein [Natronocalculus amylovorans]MCL9817599.1 Xaa-Pro peptidase family protein [Natronocalculus amylovorans]